MLIGLTAATTFTACTKDEDPVTPTPVVYGSVNTYSAKLIGGQNNATIGSFFSTSTGLVITSTAAGASATIQGTVDLAYFFGTSNGASVGAPSDSVVGVAHNGSTSLGTWTVKNSTKLLVTALTPAQFTASANDSLVKTVTDNATLSATLANSLDVGDVVAFKTVAGKFGLFHVSAIGGTTGTDRTITLDVKVQQ